VYNIAFGEAASEKS